MDPPLEDGDARLIIPTDVRPPVHAAKKPPPMSGGTLLVTRSGTLAVASDPERDTILVADIASGSVHGTIALEQGDEPGRLVEDLAGRVHVALRGAGAVVTIDPGARSVVDRREVCGAPRGLALSGSDTIAVACADGKLLFLPAGAGAVTRSIALEPDLRDVVSTNGSLTVTRFKGAEVLHLDESGSILRRDRPPSVNGVRTVPVESDDQQQFGGISRELVQPFRPLVAWRTLAAPNGTTVMIHQRAVDGQIEIIEPTLSGSSYGGNSFGAPSCSGIAQNAVTVLGPDGATIDLTFAGAPLPVDATLLADGRTLIVAHAGPPDPAAPRPFVLFDGDGMGFGGVHGGMPGIPTLSVVTLPAELPSARATEGSVAPDPGCLFPAQIPVFDPAVAVAANPVRPQQVVAQTRQPSSLVIVDDVNQAWNVRTIRFDDGATLDTGFQLFHRDSGGGIACASCHPEGAEDGHVWRFSGIGARRTQALNVRLEGTAPFHWDGTLPSVGALMSEVFVGRMGGIHESPERLRGLEAWIFGLEPPARLRSADDASAQRGKALFEATSTGCASCHSGPKLTNNATVDVGTSRLPLQVPTLVGIGYRAPFMHDGCAPTLAARFDPACGGGEQHGRTAHLTPEELGDLVAYLESI